MFDGATQIARRGDGIVIEKINQFSARFAQAGVALNGGLPASGDDDLQKFRWIIKLARRIHCGNVGLPGPRGNKHGDGRQGIAHAHRLWFSGQNSIREEPRELLARHGFRAFGPDDVVSAGYFLRRSELRGKARTGFFG